MRERNRPIARKTSGAMKRLAALGLAFGTPKVGSYGIHPIAGVEDLDPCVRVGLADVEVAGERVALARPEPHDEPRRHARGPEQQHHRARDVLAEALGASRTGSGRRRPRPAGRAGCSRSYSRVQPQPSLHRRGLVVGRGEARRDADGELHGRAPAGRPAAAGSDSRPVAGVAGRRPERESARGRHRGPSEITEYTRPGSSRIGDRIEPYRSMCRSFAGKYTELGTARGEQDVRLLGLHVEGLHDAAGRHGRTTGASISPAHDGGGRCRPHHGGAARVVVSEAVHGVPSNVSYTSPRHSAACGARTRITIVSGELPRARRSTRVAEPRIGGRREVHGSRRPAAPAGRGWTRRPRSPPPGTSLAARTAGSATIAPGSRGRRQEDAGGGREHREARGIRPTARAPRRAGPGGAPALAVTIAAVAPGAGRPDRNSHAARERRPGHAGRARTRRRARANRPRP